MLSAGHSLQQVLFGRIRGGVRRSSRQVHQEAEGRGGACPRDLLYDGSHHPQVLAHSPLLSWDQQSQEALPPKGLHRFRRIAPLFVRQLGVGSDVILCYGTRRFDDGFLLDRQSIHTNLPFSSHYASDLTLRANHCAGTVRFGRQAIVRMRPFRRDRMVHAANQLMRIELSADETHGSARSYSGQLMQRSCPLLDGNRLSWGCSSVCSVGGTAPRS